MIEYLVVGDIEQGNPVFLCLRAEAIKRNG